MVFKIGQTAWNKGKKMNPFSKITKEKMSIAKRGKQYRLGHKFSIKTKEKMRIAKLGDKNPMKKLEVRKKFQGSKSHFWKGGVSPYTKIVKRSFEYRDWRRKVFERDDYTCQQCKIKGIYLEPHHIKGFTKYPDLRFEVSNGLTLCRECHKLTDNYKGKAKNI
jgi:predicted restriction endonuclease